MNNYPKFKIFLKLIILISYLKSTNKNGVNDRIKLFYRVYEGSTKSEKIYHLTNNY